MMFSLRRARLTDAEARCLLAEVMLDRDVRMMRRWGLT
jgi:hypothetical protein